MTCMACSGLNWPAVSGESRFPPGVVDPRVMNMPMLQLSPECESVLGTMPALVFTGNLRVRDQLKGLGGSHGVRIGRS